MTRKEHALSLLTQALQEVEEEIERHKKGDGKVCTLFQLNSLRIDLRNIMEEIASRRLSPKNQRDRGIGYTVVDSWGPSIELGDLLLKAERAYQEL